MILNESLLYPCVCCVMYIMRTCDTERVFVVCVCVLLYIMHTDDTG